MYRHMKSPPLILVLTALIVFWAVPPAQAFLIPHPLKTYEKGREILDHYHGEQAELERAKMTFLDIVEKYPDSPFGYLGLSRVYRVEACQSPDRYDMSVIRDISLPFAIKALELGASIREVHENYVYFERIFEQYENDQAKAKEYLNSFPDSPQTYFILANFMRDQGKTDKAVAFYKEALTLNPSRILEVKILKRIANIYLEIDDRPEKALEYLKKAASSGLDQPVIQDALGRAYLRLKKYEEAIECFQAAVRDLPLPDTRLCLLQAQGLLKEREGRVQEAITFLERASGMDEQNSSLHYVLGNLYYKNKDFDQAYIHFKDVIDLQPESADAYFFAGRSVHSLGDQEEAAGYFQKFLKLQPDGKEASWIRDNIPGLSQGKE